MATRPDNGRRRIRLGTTVQGAGVTRWGWKHPDVELGSSADFDFYLRMAQLAEAASFDFMFIADALFVSPHSAPHSLNRLEPLTLLGGLAASTKRIGLVGTASTSFTEPYTLARQFASIDLISGGRAGWNLVTTGLEGAALNFGRTRHLDHATRYRMAREHLSIVRGLWDSWEDDAFVGDRETGRFILPDRLHTLDHRGEFFEVRGPLNIARSPQGHPVIFQAGSSEDGRELAAAGADAIIGIDEEMAEAQAFYADVKRRAIRHGRDPEQLIVFAGINATVGATAAEAEEKFEARAALISIEEAVGQLGRLFSYLDLSSYPLDAPFPDLGRAGENGYRSSTDRIKDVAARRGLTLRETAMMFARRHGEFVGSAEQIADRLEQWADSGAADGFILFPTDLPNLRDFTERVVPILQRRGLCSAHYKGNTLRSHLGLPFADNIHSLARHDRAPPSIHTI